MFGKAARSSEIASAVTQLLLVFESLSPGMTFAESVFTGRALGSKQADWRDPTSSATTANYLKAL